MGIPKFLRTLIRRYPLIVQNIKYENDIPPIDNLYLDINLILHLLSHSREHNLLALTKKKTDEDIYRETCEFINQIVKLIKPKSFLMIVLDGVCPIAKISNQVISRYISSLYNFEEINNFLESINLKKVNDFDGNKIFPCTEFMINFEGKLIEYIETKKKESEIWKNLDLIFSGTNVPGEGDYKIMGQIREQKEKEAKNKINEKTTCTKYCIFSSDADFILLSLLIHEPNIVLLKSGIANNNKYNFEFNEENNKLLFDELIFISVLREFLSLEFQDIFKKIPKFNIERLYDDFAFLCLLLGNDYIPGIMFLDTNGEMYENLLDSYKKSIERFDKKDCYLTDGGKINFSNFNIFINELNNKEIYFIKLKNKLFKSFKNPKKQTKFSNMKLLDFFKHILNETTKKFDNSYDKLKYALNSNCDFSKKINSIINITIMKFDKESSYHYKDTFINRFKKKYKTDKYEGEKMYYKEKFNIKLDIKKREESSELNNIIINYLAGLQWNLYYYKGFLNWNYNYIYNYSPLILSLSKFDSSIKSEIIEKAIYENNDEMDKEGKPLPPYILQCLTFPSSLNSCKEELNLYKTNFIGFLPNYFKSKFIIDNNGFSFHSQTTVIFPKIRGKEMIKQLRDFDEKEFKNTNSYEKIKNNYRKEYISFKDGKNFYNEVQRKNEIHKDCYDNNENDINNNISDKSTPKKVIKNNQSKSIKNNPSFNEENEKKDNYIEAKNGLKIDMNFPSLDNINKVQFIKTVIKNTSGSKKMPINSLFINISLDDEGKIKKMLENKDIIKNTIKEKIISYGYPFLKIGLLRGFYYANKYYTFNERDELIKNEYTKNYEKIIQEDYEYIGLKFDHKIFCLIEVLPIIFIDNGNCVYDYDYKYLIPLEITSVLYDLECEEPACKKKIIFPKVQNQKKCNNKYKEFLNIKTKNKINTKLDKNLLDKNKQIFLYNENSRNKHYNEKNNNKKNEPKNKKGKRNNINKSELLDNNIQINFKFNFDDCY